MDNLATKRKPLKSFSLSDKNLLSTDIKLIKFFNKKPWLQGLITEENYEAPSDYLCIYEKGRRTFKRYYE